MRIRPLSLLVLASVLGAVSSFSIVQVPSAATHKNNVHPQAAFEGGRTRVRQDSSLKLSPFAAIARAYDYGVTNHYLLTESLTFSVFCIFGDLIAQTREIHKRKAAAEDGAKVRGYDLKRCGRFAVKGLGCGVLWSTWYKLAEGWAAQISTRAMSILSPTNTSPALYKVYKTVSSVLLEQFIACPVVYTFWDIPILTLLNGKVPIGRIPHEIRTKLHRLLIANAKMWSIANIFIYNVPLKYRVVALSGAEVIWQGIVSRIASKKTKKPEDVAVGEETDLEPTLIAAQK